MEHLGISDEVLAGRIGVSSRTTVWKRYTEQQRLDLGKIQQIADALGIGYQQLAQQENTRQEQGKGAESARGRRASRQARRRACSGNSGGNLSRSQRLVLVGRLALALVAGGRGFAFCWASRLDAGRFDSQLSRNMRIVRYRRSDLGDRETGRAPTFPNEQGSEAMEYRGVEFRILQSIPKGWRWEFEWNSSVRSGTGVDRKNAVSRVRKAIDTAIDANKWPTSYFMQGDIANVKLNPHRPVTTDTGSHEEVVREYADDQREIIKKLGPRH